MLRVKHELTPSEIRAIREHLGLSQVEAGELIGGGPSSFTKYEAGTVKPAASVINLLRLLEANPAAILTLGGGMPRPINAFGSGPLEVTGDHISVLRERDLPLLLRKLGSLLAGVVGAGLAVVGVAMQATVRNPLADPYLLGTSSGASVGAVLVIMLGINFLEPYSLSILAFVGAVGSFVIVFAVSQTGGRVSPTRLILAGVATAYVLTAITSLILFLGDERAVRTVLFWMLGTLSGAEWSFLGLPAAALLLGISILVLKYRSMNALLAGEETAITLGVDTQGLRRQLLVLTALITGVMVAVSGAIGFVGLMMSHIVRLVVGADHRIVLPTSALAGGIFLISVDVVARTVVQPQEIPVRVITALVGAPFFLWLLRWRRQAYGGRIRCGCSWIVSTGA